MSDKPVAMDLHDATRFRHNDSCVLQWYEMTALSPWWVLPTLPALQRYHWYSLPSSHTLALTWAESLPTSPHGVQSVIDNGGWVCLTSSQQPCGVGQFERTFLAPEGGLYVSLISLWPNTPHVPPIALATGLVVAQVLGADYRLKWVNDVYWYDKKVAGVLVHRHTSSVHQNTVCVISLGLNVNSQPPWLPSQYASVRQIHHKRHDIDALLQRLMAALHTAYGHLIHQQGRLPRPMYDEIRQRALYWQEAYDSLIPIEDGGPLSTENHASRSPSTSPVLTKVL